MSRPVGGPLVLMYHRIGTPRRPSPVGGQYVSARSFAVQRRLLQRLQKRVCPVDAVARHLRGEIELSVRDIAITFDDGFANLFTNAYPVLSRHSFDATVYLISDYIGKQNDYHAPENDLYEPLLTLEQVLEMQTSGIAFGSHTRRHARLTRCTDAELTGEIEGSRCQLEAALGHPVTSFCYPYGDQDERVRQAVIRAGYTHACSTLKGRNDLAGDPYRIRRINVRADTNAATFLYKLARARYFNR
ncbi:MAG: polysaccharide deacetylase family protein [Chloroflexi bacterium]|nr:polysaccharide deacetylase family protein [Chloroflexota bacterium]